MSIKAWNALLVIALLIVLSGGGYILYQNNLQKQAEAAHKLAEQQAEEERKAEELAALRLEFREFLDDFLVKIQTEVREYKKQREVLAGLTKPANLRQTEYIEENARLAESTVLGLQLQMETVMGLFETADEDAKTLIAKFEESERVAIEEDWASLRDENIEKFTDYFTIEQDLMMAHLALIEFYNENKDALEVDVINSRVVFDDVQKQEKEALLRGKILEIKSARRAMVSAPKL
ncbi:MAG: hypothetical protein AAF204_04140 [Pseudomonadota bacterium]